MKNIMLTATEARAKSQNDNIIFNEIRDIEDAILSSVAAGSYDATIIDTTMTSTSDSGTEERNIAKFYFNVWKGTGEDRAKYIQMGQIISYFTDLGYAIERRTNSNTGDTFKWVVSW